MVQAAFRQEDEAHLEHISGVDVVVILHVPSVALVNLANKTRNLHLVELGQLFEAKFAHKVDRQNRETLLAADVFTETDRVEVNLLCSLKVVRVTVNEVKHSGQRGSAAQTTHRV